MANGFGSLYVGASALRAQQTALDTTSNNIANIDTEGYVRQQVMFTDNSYSSFGSAAVSEQRLGIGVLIGDVIHTRDVFLDKAYRSEASRAAFYEGSYDAVSEVETMLQESYGETFSSALTDLYSAFSEYAKDPSDAVNQNLVVQKSSLFISRAQGTYNGLSDYQSTINKKISDNVDTINDLAKEIYQLNLQIQKIEAGGVETAMTLRDQRDLDLDQLSQLASISYNENNEGVTTVKLEGIDLVEETRVNTIGTTKDPLTGYVTPYWESLSDTKNGVYYEVFNMDNISAEYNTDKGETKALLLARGDNKGTYLDMEGLTSEEYNAGLANSIIKNSESELDTLIHDIVTSINDLISPLTTYEGADIEAVDDNGNKILVTAGRQIADTENCSVGSDGQVPPRELFTRVGSERYTHVTYTDADGNDAEMWLYNEEDPEDLSTCYTLRSLSVNQDLIENRTLLAYKQQNSKDDTSKDSIDYALGAKLEAIWDDASYTLNPSDLTPASFTGFYEKWISEIGTVGSVYKTTSETLVGARDSIDTNRDAVLGVSSDEELTNIIRYQNAYNAASRYVTVVSEMIDYLLSSLQ